MSLSGNLRDFQIGEILQLIGQQGKTGTLILRRDRLRLNVYFRDGAIVRGEPVSERTPSPLGELLVLAQVITPEQFSTAIERHAQTLIRVEDLLLDMEAVSEPLLNLYIDLQTVETIYRMFLARTGRYEFVVGEIPDGIGWARPIETETILMEAVRRVDEWPVLRNTIPSSDSAFELVSDDVKAEGKPSALEAQIIKRLKAQPGLTPRALSAMLRVGEFEVTQQLAGLLAAGKLTLLAKKADPVLIVEPVRVRVGRVMAHVATALFLTGATGLTAWRMVHMPSLAILSTLGNPEKALPVATHAGGTNVALFGSDPVASLSAVAGTDAMFEAFTATQLSRLHAAIGQYRIEKGEYPKTLDDVVARGLLMPDDLDYPRPGLYHYRFEGHSYDLRVVGD
jgi:hypothetical protein